MITVMARRDFVHDGHSYARGVALQVSPIDAIKLHRTGKITLSRSRPRQQPTAAIPETKQAALDPSPASTTPVGDADETTSAPRRRRGRRQYQREEIDVAETTDLSADDALTLTDE